MEIVSISNKFSSKYDLINYNPEKPKGIYYTKHTGKNEPVVIKHLRLIETEQEQNLKCGLSIPALREHRCLQAFKNHPLFVSTEGSIISHGNMNFVLPTSITTLTDIISGEQTLTKKDRIKLYFNILLACAFIHLNGFLYRDWKPDNILVNADGTLSVCDFGTSRDSSSLICQKKCFSIFEKLGNSINGNNESLADEYGTPNNTNQASQIKYNSLEANNNKAHSNNINSIYFNNTQKQQQIEQKLGNTGNVGTSFYTAPEILLGMKNYNEKSDIFSLGVTFCEVLIGCKGHSNKITNSGAISLRDTYFMKHTIVDESLVNVVNQSGFDINAKYKLYKNIRSLIETKKSKQIEYSNAETITTLSLNPEYEPAYGCLLTKLSQFFNKFKNIIRNGDFAPFTHNSTTVMIKLLCLVLDLWTIEEFTDFMKNIKNESPSQQKTILASVSYLFEMSTPKEITDIYISLYNELNNQNIKKLSDQPHKQKIEYELDSFSDSESEFEPILYTRIDKNKKLETKKAVSTLTKFLAQFDVSDEELELFNCMLKWSQTKRSSALELLKLPLFADILKEIYKETYFTELDPIKTDEFIYSLIFNNKNILANCLKTDNNIITSEKAESSPLLIDWFGFSTENRINEYKKIYDKEFNKVETSGLCFDEVKEVFEGNVSSGKYSPLNKQNCILPPTIDNSRTFNNIIFQQPDKQISISQMEIAQDFNINPSQTQNSQQYNYFQFQNENNNFSIANFPMKKESPLVQISCSSSNSPCTQSGDSSERLCCLDSYDDSDEEKENEEKIHENKREFKRSHLNFGRINNSSIYQTTKYTKVIVSNSFNPINSCNSEENENTIKKTSDDCDSYVKSKVVFDYKNQTSFNSFSLSGCFLKSCHQTENYSRRESNELLSLKPVLSVNLNASTDNLIYNKTNESLIYDDLTKLNGKNDIITPLVRSESIQYEYQKTVPIEETEQKKVISPIDGNFENEDKKTNIHQNLEPPKLCFKLFQCPEGVICNKPVQFEYQTDDPGFNERVAFEPDDYNLEKDACYCGYKAKCYISSIDVRDTSYFKIFSKTETLSVKEEPIQILEPLSPKALFDD